jgi:hypothetical protein
MLFKVVDGSMLLTCQKLLLQNNKSFRTLAENVYGFTTELQSTELQRILHVIPDNREQCSPISILNSSLCQTEVRRKLHRDQEYITYTLY